MGLENEKSETTVILDEDEFNRSIEPILNQKEKVFTATPDRDPHDINGQLKVGFEDVIAEPNTTHSFDKVWIGSHAVFELAKFVFYRLLTTLLAVPMSFVFGIVFAVLSCVHIWVVMPVFKTCMVALPSVQTIWRSLMDTFVAPLFLSAGRCLSAVSVKAVHD